jgi:hypothetical protein
VAQESMLDGRYMEILARLEGLAGRIDETREDAREARDAATKLTERVGAQDIPAKLAELKGQVEKGFSDARSDLVNTSDKITREMRDGHRDHGARLDALEAFRNKIEGAKGLMGWVAKNAPWLFAVSFAVAAAIGWKEKIP